ncbi:germacrene A synthase short form-like protein [Tanacetum coccineum]
MSSDMSSGKILTHHHQDIVTGYVLGKTLEGITGYGVNDFVREDEVEIPNRTIKDSFMNKLCDCSFISDHDENSTAGDFREGSAKEIYINDENVDQKYKVLAGVIYEEFDQSLPWSEMKPTVGLRNDYRSLMALCAKAIVKPKKELKQMRVDPNMDSNDKLSLINCVYCLGLKYMFNEEIDDQLDKLYKELRIENYVEADLCTVSLNFKVFKKHGYKLSCGKAPTNITFKQTFLHSC